MVDEEWITTGEAAKRLGVSEDTVRRLVDDNELRGKWTRRGQRGHRRVSTLGIEEYIRETQGEATTK